jgi:hypothetical protein
MLRQQHTVTDSFWQVTLSSACSPIKIIFTCSTTASYESFWRWGTYNHIHLVLNLFLTDLLILRMIFSRSLISRCIELASRSFWETFVFNKYNFTEGRFLKMSFSLWFCLLQACFSQKLFSFRKWLTSQPERVLFDRDHN